MSGWELYSIAKSQSRIADAQEFIALGTVRERLAPISDTEKRIETRMRILADRMIARDEHDEPMPVVVEPDPRDARIRELEQAIAAARQAIEAQVERSKHFMRTGPMAYAEPEQLLAEGERVGMQFALSLLPEVKP